MHSRGGGNGSHPKNTHLKDTALAISALRDLGIYLLSLEIDNGIITFKQRVNTELETESSDSWVYKREG